MVVEQISNPGRPQDEDVVEKYKDALEPQPEQGKPEDAEVVQAEKLSNIQKIKQQRDEAMSALSQLQGEVSVLKEAMLNKQQKPQVEPADLKEIEDYKLLAFSDETAQEKPGVANQAVMKLAEKIADQKVKAIKEELRQEFSGQMTHNNEQQAVWSEINQMYPGLTTESDHYKLADSIMAQHKANWKAKYGNKPIDTSFYKLSFLEAARLLPQDTPVQGNEAPKPEELVEGVSTVASADDLATMKKSALSQGNTEDAFKLVSRSLGF